MGRVIGLWLVGLIVLQCSAWYTDPVSGVRGVAVSNPVVIRVHGDVTGDGKVTALDAFVILRWVLSGKYPELQAESADWNGNERPDIADAVLCLRKAVGF